MDAQGLLDSWPPEVLAVVPMKCFELAEGCAEVDMSWCCFAVEVDTSDVVVVSSCTVLPAAVVVVSGMLVVVVAVVQEVVVSPSATHKLAPVHCLYR